MGSPRVAPDSPWTRPSVSCSANGMDGEAARRRIVELARSEGFERVSFAAAQPVAAAREGALRAWEEGRLDGLGWMTGEWLERATAPGRFLEGARSVVMVALPCHAPDLEAPAGGPSRGQVARYARGRDYHRTFEKKLRRMARAIREEFGAGARPTVDYGPLLERPLAATAGMGWLGKSTMLLVPGAGPWVLLGAVATTLAIEPDLPLAKSCGSCARCIAACPTGALSAEGHLLDARLCISYHTIENRGAVPRELRALFGDRVFGCDACLDSCPVGAKHWESQADFAPTTIDDGFPVLGELLQLDQATFDARFRGRAIMRAKRDGMARNACVALGNVGKAADFPALAAALSDPSPLVRGHAAWAIGRMADRGVADAGPAQRLFEVALPGESEAFVREEIGAAMAAATRDMPEGCN